MSPDASEPERERLRLLLEVSAAVVTHRDLGSLLHAIAGCLHDVLHCEHTTLSLFEPATEQLRVHALESQGPTALHPEGVLISMGDTPGARAFETRAPVVANSVAELEAFTSPFMAEVVAGGVRSTASVPLVVHGKALGTLSAGSVREGAFTPGVVELLGQIAAQLAPAVDNALAFREIEALKEKLAREKVYLEAELSHGFSEIVGASLPLKQVLKDVEVVAPTDATVLIQGETGTGKELVARAIHRLSGRKRGTFVKLNCASIPTGLLESELFGHEKGAFTGALAQRIGRFELADGGTLLLDEVGDIPPELQPKLLRVLQEQEFERLGGNRTHKVDVRVVAATNRDLSQLVAERAFRSDLFYRLNVFPISLPPLRERPGDVEPLVRHFVAKASARLGRRVESIPRATLEALEAYPWPGNVRELENFMERAVILSPGSTLEAPLGELRRAAEPSAVAAPVAPPAPEPEASTLEQVEREHILRTLERRSGGRRRHGRRQEARGPCTTLQGRMKRLGIERLD
ncbi:MAG: sigma 54-interacting transcriptional regulator [Planctomycetota bacterium]